MRRTIFVLAALSVTALAACGGSRNQPTNEAQPASEDEQRGIIINQKPSDAQPQPTSTPSTQPSAAPAPSSMQ